MVALKIFLVLSIVIMINLLSVKCESRDQSPGRIFNGERAGEHEFPSVVLVMTSIVSEDGKIGINYCSGVLISDEWVVTSAHCIMNSLVSGIGAGSAIRDETIEIEVEKIITHEDFHFQGEYKQKIANDIGLLKVISSFTLDGVKIAASTLPTEGQQLDVSSIYVTLSWTKTTEIFGRTIKHNTVKELQKLYVNVITCPVMYDTGMICVQAPINTGLCNGDSGAPLLLNGVIQGIASFADMNNTNPANTPCDEKDSWIVYTPISNFRQWIHLHTGI